MIQGFKKPAAKPGTEDSTSSIEITLAKRRVQKKNDAEYKMKFNPK